MVQKQESSVTYHAETVTKVLLGDRTLFPTSSTENWMHAVAERDGLTEVSFAGDYVVGGLQDALEKSVTRIAGQCAVGSFCKLRVSLPGANSGEVEDTTLRLECPLPDFPTENQATVAEIRCGTHHQNVVKDLSYRVMNAPSAVRSARAAVAAAETVLVIAESNL